jgi:hypothetical protein
VATGLYIMEGLQMCGSIYPLPTCLMLFTGKTLPWRIVKKYYYYLTANGLTPSCSSIHLYTNSTQNTEDGTFIKVFPFMDCKMKNEGLQEVCINFGLMAVSKSLALLIWNLVSNRLMVL